MKQYGLAALASVLAAISSANAFVLVDTEAGAAVNQASQVPCAGQMAAVDCQMAPRDDLLFKGVANKLTCLAASSNALSKECFIGEVDSTLDFIVEQQGSKCKDELRSKCGKQIDALKKAIEHTSVIGTVKGAVDVVECIVNHAEDLWDHCKPGQKALEETTLAVEENSPSCEARAVELCPTTQHKVLGLGFTLGCLVEKAPVLGDGCAHERIAAALDDLENSADRPCHDELRKKCGKQIDQLKKEIQATSVLGTLKAAVDVVQCVAQNAEDLWNKCKPFEGEMHDEDESAQEILLEDDPREIELAFVAGAPTPPTRKPTHKPTHRPTKRPTNKPTLRPTGKPTKSDTPTTSRPTPRKISDYLVNTVVAVEPEQLEIPEENDRRYPHHDDDDRRPRPYPHHDDDDRRPRPYPHHDDDDRRPHPHHDDDDRRPHPHHDDDDRRPRPHPHHHDDDRRPCPHHHDEEHHRHHHHRHHGHGGGMMMDTRGGVHFSNKMEEVEMMGEEGELVEAGFEFDMEECVRSARKFCAAEVADFNASPFDRNLLEAMNGCIERNAAIIEADCMVRSVEVYRVDPAHGHHHRCRKFWKHVAAGVFALLFTVVLARKCYVKRMKAKLANQGEVVQAEPQYQPLVDAKGPSMV